jgi:tRNA dimethylallyltransferase
MSAVLIAGPTASGKSSVAFELARRVGGALINTDSMQVYREVRILSARPGEEMLAPVPHYLYGHVSVQETYSVARFQADAIGASNEVRADGRVPIFVGGTGLYFAVLTEGLARIPSVPEAIRQSVRARRVEIGAERFFTELAARDPETTSRLRPSDTQRVLRAAEVLEASGRPLSEWQRSQGSAPLAGYALSCFVLSPSRAELYRRIDERFDRMVAAGALEEAAQLKGLDRSLPAAKLLGLREIWAVLDHKLTLDAARAAVKTATRQYAKRQLTWFRNRMAEGTWIESGEPDTSVQQIERVL